MNVYEKLETVQTELNAPKGQFNSFGNYNYRSCEDILEAVKPILKKVNAVVLLTDNIEIIGEYTYVRATAKFVDVESKEEVTVDALARHAIQKKGMDDAQVTGATSSYARKYALNGLFCIDDNKDADTNEYPQSSVEDIIKGIKEKMNLNNWKGFYKRAIELYPKGTEEYKAWIEAFNETKSILDNTGSTPAQFLEDVDFLKEV